MTRTGRRCWSPVIIGRLLTKPQRNRRHGHRLIQPKTNTSTTYGLIRLAGKSSETTRSNRWAQRKVRQARLRHKRYATMQFRQDLLRWAWKQRTKVTQKPLMLF